MLEKLFRDFMLIWTTVDPIGNLAIFSGLTASLSRAEPPARMSGWKA